MNASNIPCRWMGEIETEKKSYDTNIIYVVLNLGGIATQWAIEQRKNGGGRYGGGRTVTKNNHASMCLIREDSVRPESDRQKVLVFTLEWSGGRPMGEQW